MRNRELSSRIIACAIRVHRELGPGLFESTYEECMAYELTEARIPFRAQVAIPLSYKGVGLECGFRADLVVERRVIVELKSVESLQPVHEAQLLTYMRVSGIDTGLLINFNVARLKDGIKRMVL